MTRIERMLEQRQMPLGVRCVESVLADRQRLWWLPVHSANPPHVMRPSVLNAGAARLSRTGAPRPRRANTVAQRG
jgi:hypothetical protein